MREVAQILRIIRAEVNAAREVSCDTKYVQRSQNEALISRLDVLDVFLPFNLLEKVRVMANRGLSQRGQNLSTYRR